MGALSLSARRFYVLVVEDDPALRELYRAALRDAGFSVVAVEDGLSALHSVESQKPNAVVLDLELPRVGGLDVQQELKASPDTHEIPIILVTGMDTSGLNRDEFDCILRKPISPDQLIDAIHQCLRKKRMGPSEI